MKNLLIAGADLYDFSKIKQWISSFRAVNKTADVVVLAYRVTEDILANAKTYNYTVLDANYNEYGQPLNHNKSPAGTLCHQTRFSHIYQYLSENKYDFVLTTDCRDVLFQKDPFEYIRYHCDPEISSAPADLIVSSEGIRYEDEPWNAQNFISGYGPYLWNKIKHEVCYNVGVLAGTGEAIKQLSLLLYQLSHREFVPNDQSSFNYLLHLTPFKFNVKYTDHSHGWNANLGVMMDPTKAHLKVLDQRPVINHGLTYESGFILTPISNQPYYITHQLDRIPEFEKLFG